MLPHALLLSAVPDPVAPLLGHHVALMAQPLHYLLLRHRPRLLPRCHLLPHHCQRHLAGVAAVMGRLLAGGRTQ